MNSEKFMGISIEKIKRSPAFGAEGKAIDFIIECERRREELGLSYSDMARKMGCSRSYVSQLMEGHGSMTFRTMQKLAYALDFDFRILVLPNRGLRGNGKGSKAGLIKTKKKAATSGLARKAEMTKRVPAAAGKGTPKKRP
ncbi:MAG: helix-turn-helix transcriptional regulator [bacterium]|jgi:transcriptional regulator with XRE-family HTH domain